MNMFTIFRIQTLFFVIAILFPGKAWTQQTTLDHWETVVYADSFWRYTIPDANTPNNWRDLNFDDSNWALGKGGFGYGDGDDSTVLAPSLSVFIRQTFVIPDSMNPFVGLLHADYDDGFIAYLNGQALARGNMDSYFAPYDATAPVDHEAQIYQGGNPAAYYLSPDFLAEHLNDSLNVLAVQIHNWSPTSSDLTGRFYLSFGLQDSTVYGGGTHDFFYEGFLSSNLPLIFIQTDSQNIQNDNRISANMQVIDQGPAARNYVFDPPNNYDGRISIEIRGSSSAFLFPKVNYGFETQDSLGENLNVELLGLPAENDWTLHGPYSDKSLIRNAVVYELGRRMGHYAPRTKFCELFINQEYLGLYLLVEKIKRDKNRLDIARLTPSDTLGDELTGGYILKIDREEPPGGGWFSPYGNNPYYAFHHPSADQLHPLQKTYIRNWIQNWEFQMSRPGFADPVTGYRQYIDVPSFVDFFLANELTQNVDAFRLSAFLYKRKDSNGGKLYQGPLWDFNLGFGNADYCLAGLTSGWALGNCGNHPFWWQKLFNESYFANELSCRWEALRQGPLHQDSIYQLIDSMVLDLGEAQPRNETRWQVLDNYVWPNEFVGSTYVAEINYLKNWIGSRLSWMDGQLSGCVPTPIEASALFPLQVYPNPAREQLQLRLPALTQSANWTLYDLQGRAILQTLIPPGQTQQSIPLSRLVSGMYNWRFQTQEGVWGHGKLVIE
jgi:hypothetical protein